MTFEKAFEGAFQTFEEIASGGQKTDKLREDIFREELDNIIVDTCIAFDTDKWETGIDPGDGHFVIVEQYETREDAEQGHQRWVQAMKDSPKQELEDIDLWGLGL